MYCVKNEQLKTQVQSFINREVSNMEKNIMKQKLLRISQSIDLQGYFD